MPIPPNLAYVGVQYAASGRSCCKGCKDELRKGSLRMITSYSGDYDTSYWHSRCFFDRYKTLQSPDEVSGFTSLRPSDKERLKNTIERHYTPVAPKPVQTFGGGLFGAAPAPASSGSHRSNDFDFKLEYAKSNRSKCTTCFALIDQDTLRFARMVQSPHFDGRVPKWSHYDCFFKYPVRINSTSQIDGFNAVRWADQEKTCRKLGIPVPAAAAAPAENAGEGQGDGDVGGPSSVHAAGGDNADDGGKPMEVDAQNAPPVASAAEPAGPPPSLTVECAAHNRASCKTCKKKIEKGEARVGREEAKGKSTTTSWYHRDCFMANAAELANGAAVTRDLLRGFCDLPEAEQKAFSLDDRKRKAETDAGPGAKKPRTDGDVSVVLKTQNERVWKVRDALKDALLPGEMRTLLKHNGMETKGGVDTLVERLTDAMLFGVPLNHAECGGALRFAEQGYVCTGQATEWAACDFATRTPTRKVFQMLDDGFDESVPALLKNLEFNVNERLFAGSAERYRAPVPAAGVEGKPLAPYKVIVVGKFDRAIVKIHADLKSLGATTTTTFTRDTNLCIAAASALSGVTMGYVRSQLDGRIVEAMNAKVPIVTEEFLKEAMTTQTAPKPSDYLAYDPNAVAQQQQQAAIAIPTDPKFASLIVKGRAAVDPQSGLADTYHVLEDGDEIYSATLGLVDVAKDINSFYKIQVLQHDKFAKEYRLFRSWGRVGTGIGSFKVDNVGAAKATVKHFMAVFEEKTGLTWDTRSSGTKIPGKFFPIEIAYKSPNVQVNPTMPIGTNSKLPVQVQDLMKALLDVKAMQRALQSYDIDMNKMPLGKLSAAQITSAYSVLSDLQRLLETEAPRKTQLVAATNRFYTMIPHVFPSGQIVLIDTIEKVIAKTHMLDALMEMEVAAKMMEESRAAEANSDEDPLDASYHQLHTDIQVLPRDTDDFKMIETYLINTHAATHSHYGLEIMEAYRVEREGEGGRFKAKQAIGNRKLLWHGSRVTNHAGILRTGLRIAPPEAPSTGYMFGKGVYFADMVSKSANYCFVDGYDPHGYILLADVALGDTYELTHSEFVTKLPDGKHSTKGLGSTHPDPTVTQVIPPDGVVVPLGKGVPSNVKNTSLLYNEYIVYDVSQIHLRYLLKVKFNYGRP